MTTFGLTSAGFVPKRLEDAKTELEASFRDLFGAGIKTTPDTVFGKLIGLIAEREASLWEMAEAVYNSQYPNTATGISLANIGDITDVSPNPATKSTAVVYVGGTESSVIPSGTLVATSEADDRFRFTSNVVIEGGDINAEEITRTSSTATVFCYEHGLDVGDFVFIEGANQDEYNGLKEAEIIVDPDHFQFTVEGTPTSPATGIIQVSEATRASVEALRTGPVQALAGTLTEIVNPVIGWSKVSNPEDADLGRDAETDEDFRTRRKNALRGLGAARLEAILGAILGIDGVTKSVVFENDTDEIDDEDRPPHSIECLVIGGEDQDIFNMVWNKKAAGIQAYGNQDGVVVDSQGIEHTVSFSRPESLPVWLELDITANDEFPDDGDELLEAAILTYAEGLQIGQDVIVFPTLISIMNDIPGITDIVVRIGTSGSPTEDDNVIVGSTQIAEFDSGRIDISVDIT